MVKQKQQAIIRQFLKFHSRFKL